MQGTTIFVPGDNQIPRHLPWDLAFVKSSASGSGLAVYVSERIPSNSHSGKRKYTAICAGFRSRLYRLQFLLPAQRPPEFCRGSDAVLRFRNKKLLFLHSRLLHITRLIFDGKTLRNTAHFARLQLGDNQMNIIRARF